MYMWSITDRHKPKVIRKALEVAASRVSVFVQNQPCGVGSSSESSVRKVSCVGPNRLESSIVSANW